MNNSPYITKLLREQEIALGKEFYKRFEEELPPTRYRNNVIHVGPTGTEDFDMGFDSGVQSAREAAKRAFGLMEGEK